MSEIVFLVEGGYRAKALGESIVYFFGLGDLTGDGT